MYVFPPQPPPRPSPLVIALRCAGDTVFPVLHITYTRTNSSLFHYRNQWESSRKAINLSSMQKGSQRKPASDTGLTAGFLERRRVKKKRRVRVELKRVNPGGRRNPKVAVLCASFWTMRAFRQDSSLGGKFTARSSMFFSFFPTWSTSCNCAMPHQSNLPHQEKKSQKLPFSHV